MKYKPYENEFWNEKETKNLFQTLSFYNVLTENLRLRSYRTKNYCMNFLFMMN